MATIWLFCSDSISRTCLARRPAVVNRGTRHACRTPNLVAPFRRCDGFTRRRRVGYGPGRRAAAGDQILGPGALRTHSKELSAIPRNAPRAARAITEAGPAIAGRRLAHASTAHGRAG